MLVFGVKTGAGGLGLIGFVLAEPEGEVYFHNPLLEQNLRSFLAFRKLGLNWVCFFGLRNHLFFCNPLL